MIKHTPPIREHAAPPDERLIALPVLTAADGGAAVLFPTARLSSDRPRLSAPPTPAGAGRSPCKHHYLLLPPDGPTSWGTCKYCLHQREFLNGGAWNERQLAGQGMQYHVPPGERKAREG